MIYTSVSDIPNWKIYDNDAKNARIWFEGYCRLADAGIALLNERDKLRARIKRLSKRQAR